MRVQFRLNLRRFVLAVIALLSFGAILLKQSDQYLRVSAAPQSLASVNAASYASGPLARGSLVSIFGNDLAPVSDTALTIPAPYDLAGVTLQLTSSDGVTHSARLVFVSNKQINFVIPEDSALGQAKIAVKNRAGAIIGEGSLEVVNSAPALFATGSDRKLAVGTTG